MTGSDARLVWVTRAQPGAARTAARLRARGYAPLVAPLIETHALAFVAPPATSYDLLAFTSAAGVAAFALAFDRDAPRPPVFTVGDATADAARAAGFGSVRSAGGDGAALCALILAETPVHLRVLHPTALHPAFPLAAALRQQGRDAQSLPVYETRPVLTTPAAARQALMAAAVRAILIHSPAAGRALAALPLSLEAGIGIVALSAACADPVRGLTRRVLTAAAPTEDELLAALNGLGLHADRTEPPADLGKPVSPV